MVESLHKLTVDIAKADNESGAILEYLARKMQYKTANECVTLANRLLKELGASYNLVMLVN